MNRILAAALALALVAPSVANADFDRAKAEAEYRANNAQYQATMIQIESSKTIDEAAKSKARQAALQTFTDAESARSRPAFDQLIASDNAELKRQQDVLAERARAIQETNNGRGQLNE